MFRESGELAGEAWTLTHLAATQLGQGSGQLAIDYCQQAMALAKESR